MGGSTAKLTQPMAGPPSCPSSRDVVAVSCTDSMVEAASRKARVVEQGLIHIKQSAIRIQDGDHLGYGINNVSKLSF